MSKITLDWLNQASLNDFIAALANIVEHSPGIARAIFAKKPFATVASLRDALLDELSGLPVDQKLELIRLHPDLANKTQRAAGLTADSVAEQDGAGLDRLSEAEFREFETFNNAYKAKFEFPFILCVKRHTKDSVLNLFDQRLKNAVDDERETAISEIQRIATLRLSMLVDGPDILPVTGWLSTHVLDTRDGVPAAGVSIELWELSALGEDRLIAKTETNSDGRTDIPLIHGRPMPIGLYELRFNVAPYFASRSVSVSDPAFLSLIPIRFGIAEPETHLHVPLLVTPWSYSTYRGS